ncbi:glutathione S-transferase family protein [Paraburkholderia sp. GAS42]|jgi:glutathione S-transferase|uniref:glutathione S-transferase family protein n=1 Tax=Paraburkholderia sp. GAS42 TaxID=3035135 RepID=UPI003D190A5D
MFMELYGRRSSINVQKVLWCLAELSLIEGRDFQRIDAGLQFGVVNTPEFLALNPNGLVPTLVDGDVVLWESNTIVRYLASSRGAGALLPVDPAARAEVERWMDWQLGTLWATLRVAFLGLTRVPEAERNYDAIKTSHREAARLLRIADDALCHRLFLAQRRFTVADIGVALAAVRWFDLAEQFADVFGTYAELPFLRDWLGRMTDRPAYRVAVRQ